MLHTFGGCSIQYRSMEKVDSDGIQPGFPCPDANGFLDVGHENLAVADPPGLGRASDRVDRLSRPLAVPSHHPGEQPSTLIHCRNTTKQERLPQKQGLCQVVEASDFEMLSDF